MYLQTGVDGFHTVKGTCSLKNPIHSSPTNTPKLPMLHRGQAEHRNPTCFTGKKVEAYTRPCALSTAAVGETSTCGLHPPKPSPLGPRLM